MDTHQSAFPLGLHPVSLGKSKEMGWNGPAAALGCTHHVGRRGKANPGAVLGYRYTDKSRFNALNVFLYFCISVTPFRPDFSRLNCDLSVGLQPKTGAGALCHVARRDGCSRGRLLHSWGAFFGLVQRKRPRPRKENRLLPYPTTQQPHSRVPYPTGQNGLAAAGIYAVLHLTNPCLYYPAALISSRKC